MASDLINLFRLAGLWYVSETGTMASASVNILTEATLNLRVGEGYGYKANVETIVRLIFPGSDRKMDSSR